MSNKKWKMGQIYVAFSEYLNFKYCIAMFKCGTVFEDSGAPT